LREQTERGESKKKRNRRNFRLEKLGGSSEKKNRRTPSGRVRSDGVRFFGTSAVSKERESRQTSGLCQKIKGSKLNVRVGGEKLGEGNLKIKDLPA